MSELNAKHMLHSYICSCLNHASECCNSNCECHKTSNDDIVTRLRETVDSRTSLVSNGIKSVRAQTQLMIDAADEIELLRTEVEKWKRLYRWEVRDE